MKNFKLLLGATALLSTTLTANVMANSVTTDFKVKVTVTDEQISAQKIQDLDFGIIYSPDRSNQQLTLTLAPDGSVSGNALSYSVPQPAIVISDTHNNNEEDLPSNVDIIVSGDEDIVSSDGKICGHISAWTHDTFHYYDTQNLWNQGFHIGASFTTPSKEEFNNWDAVTNA